MRGGFTYQELATFTEREIHWFQRYYQKNPTHELSFNTQHSYLGGPTLYFALDASGVTHQSDATIIELAVALECSQVAADALLLYRGSHFIRDEPYHDVHHVDPVLPLPIDSSDTESTKTKRPHSLSFGVSLFAGCLYDIGATAFAYMKAQPNAYAIAIPIRALRQAPFYVPPGNSLVQLFGEGELFH